MHWGEGLRVCEWWALFDWTFLYHLHCWPITFHRLLFLNVCMYAIFTTSITSVGYLSIIVKNININVSGLTMFRLMLDLTGGYFKFLQEYPESWKEYSVEYLCQVICLWHFSKYFFNHVGSALVNANITLILRKVIFSNTN